MTVQTLGSVVLVWAALIGTASVGVHLRVLDRTSTMSRHLLIYMAAIALVLDLGVVRIFWSGTWWFEALRLVAFALVAVVMTQRLWLQVQAQRTTARTSIVPDDVQPDRRAGS